MESFESLKACPFCGKKEFLKGYTGKHLRYVACDNCGCEGPLRKTWEEAKEAWNQRACRKVSKKDLEMIAYSFPWHLLDLLPSNDDQKDYLIRAIIKIWERIKSI